MSSIYQNHRTLWKLTLCFFCLTSCAITAQAKDYKVEAVIFENLNPSQATESHNYREARNMPSRSNTWELPPSLLVNQAAAIKRSGDYRIIKHLSWGQQSLRYRDSATYNVADQAIRGAIKVYADSLLFVNLDLDYDGYRMNEKRRLKLNEKHFFDHPKFGIMLQVSRLEKPEEEETKADESAQSTDESEDSEAAEILESSR